MRSGAASIETARSFTPSRKSEEKKARTSDDSTEATTAELAEFFGVTWKTICEWAQSGVVVKLRHGRYDLRESVKNWAEYQRCLAEGGDLELWEIRREHAWSLAHPDGETPEEIAAYYASHPEADPAKNDLESLEQLDEFELGEDGRYRLVGKAQGHENGSGRVVAGRGRRRPAAFPGLPVKDR